MSLALERRNLLKLGSCPRCGSSLEITNTRINEYPMVVCSKPWILKNGKVIGFCGFLWYAPWAKPVLLE